MICYKLNSLTVFSRGILICATFQHVIAKNA